MSSTPQSRSSPQPSREARYIASRMASETAPPCFRSGDTVDEVRLSLERAQLRGCFRVFDREPSTRGVDSELIGELRVDSAGAVHWKPLRSV